MSSELAHALAKATGLPLHLAEKGVKAIFREIVLITNQGDPVRIHDFGTFELVTKESRVMRSHLPRLGGKAVTVPARRRLVFRPIRPRTHRPASG